jgi:prepilin-type N-terminal cleavage/methylation domain-containing protein
MKAKFTPRPGFTLVELLVVIAIIATLAGVGVPVIMRGRIQGFLSEATQNSKQVGMALFNFEREYGAYPENDTAEKVKESNPDSGMELGNTYSNDYFRQLLAAGTIDSENSFFAKTTYTGKPDNSMKGKEALKAGECGFAYIMATESVAISSSAKSRTPLVAAAVYNGATDGSFDLDVYDRKAVVFRLDSSASVESIRPSDKKVLVGGGKTLLQTGDDTVWGIDMKPVIKAPQKKPGS